MWKPTSIVLSKRRSALSGPRLGQLSQSIVDQAARAVISEAEPRVRLIVREERSRLANAAIEGLPYAAASAAVFVAASQLVPSGSPTLKSAGYVTAAGLLAIGAWQTLSVAAGPETPPTPSSSSDTGIPFLTSTAQQLAQAVVREAEPKVRALVDDERAKLGGAVENALPFLGASAAAFLGTAYLIPKEKPSWKFAGYMGSAAALLLGAWRGLTMVAE